MSSRSNQQPHNRNKPAFSEKQTIELVERIFGLKVAELKPLPSYDDQNFHVRVPKLEGTGDYAEEYVVKIINGEDSQNPGLIEVQTEIMMFLNKEGFPVPAPRSTKGGEIMFLESVDADSSTQGYLVRLLTYLPGKTVATIPMSPPVLYEIGQLAAKLDQTIAEKFRHPLIGCLHRGEFIWNLANVPLLERYIYALGQSEYLEVVKQIIEQFKARIVPKLSTFRPCINHGDLNDHNILLDTDSVSSPSSHYRVSGILDFSDMSYGCYVFEVAITIMYMMIESKDPLRAGGHILAGFESIVPLMTEERDALFLLVCGRFAQSLVMAAHTTLLHPENEEYLMITARTGWKHLMKLFEMGQEAVEKIWFETAGTYT
ncbi:hydroxylysine kinase isoform X2 [Hemicordylus capensis]|nr:hydroxylysine kinase isoform X2 [Hemicordylus capensis]XP_053128711.1 hydroxylysine kinase isoform X2 [Hemicordylus capensis]XP_053128712.1 hydroxylysine kinase isoform X2 [Hemicordylus capensis]